MREIRLSKGLDIPIDGRPKREIGAGRQPRSVALIGDDYPGMKPTMLVEVGDRVQCGQPVFTDKKNEGVIFTAPGGGEVVAVNRGEKRRFLSLVIRLDEKEDCVSFCEPQSTADTSSADRLRQLLVDSGLWCALRTRPYGKIPTITATPASLFVTAIDTAPLAPYMNEVISLSHDDFVNGLAALRRCIERPIYLCLPEDGPGAVALEGIEPVRFIGPHPAGLPSTHIHFLDPVKEGKTVWQIGAQDVIAIGALLRTGRLVPERIISLGGPSVKNPRHLRTRLGASIADICEGELADGDNRKLSGSVLDGRQADEHVGYLGRYHQQISCLPEGTGRSFFGWLRPGVERFSVTRAFYSAFRRPQRFAFDTAVWGGHRAIFPLGTYERVMPLDIIPVYLLKSLASGNTEKAKQLGCLELIEEDLALCSFVCPGKNDFAPMLRETLTSIEIEG